MTASPLAAAITDERSAMVDLLVDLDDEQLRTPSLCAGWTVHHVAAHLTVPFNISFPGLLWRAMTEPMSLRGAIDRLAQEHARRPIEGIVAQLRDHVADTAHPPGQPVAPLVDLLVHGEDIRRALGMARPISFDRAAAAMTFVTQGRAFGFVPGSRLRGLRFVATDGDRAWGHGQIVHGPVLELLLGVMGRRVALEHLGGAVQILRERLDPPVARAKRRA